MRSIEIPTEPFVGWMECTSNVKIDFFQITAVAAVLKRGLALCMYFVFRKCTAVRLRLRIRTQYYIMVWEHSQITWPFI